METEVAIKLTPRDAPGTMLGVEVTGQLCEGRLISGRFKLDRELGRGGMGTVWEARHLALETQVAIKFLKNELSQRQDIRARFALEATSAARIRSPHVVTVLDSGFTEDDWAFIVMELLHGEDLGRRLARIGHCSVNETRELVSQVARGLAKAHGVGIVHRDLKPENLFVTDDDELTIKILDFGIAKAFGPEASTHKTDTGQLLGTPMYMSPEQALGRVIDARSDLYSLAVVAYRCLAGRTPFDHAAPGEMIVAVSTQPAPPPSKFNPALPPELDAWFAGMLVKDPAARASQTASELAESFERACGAALRSSSAPPVVVERRVPQNLPGATLVSEGEGEGADAKVPSAAEVATTVLVPNFSAQLERRRPGRPRTWVFGALGVAAGATLALGLRAPQQSAPPSQASTPRIVTHDEPAVPGVLVMGVEAPVPAITSSSPQAAPVPTSNAPQKSSSATSPKSLAPRPSVMPAAPAASLDLHSTDTQEPIASVSALTSAPSIAEPQASGAAPRTPAPAAAGIDRASPW